LFCSNSPFERRVSIIYSHRKVVIRICGVPGVLIDHLNAAAGKAGTRVAISDGSSVPTTTKIVFHCVYNHGSFADVVGVRFFQGGQTIYVKVPRRPVLERMELFHVTDMFQTFIVLVAAMISAIRIIVSTCCATVVVAHSAMNSICVNVNTVILAIPEVANFTGKYCVAMVILEELDETLDTAWLATIIAVLFELTESVLTVLCDCESNH